MIWLLDVNALIAALVAAHEHHDRVGSWLATLPGIPKAMVIPD